MINEHHTVFSAKLVRSVDRKMVIPMSCFSTSSQLMNQVCLATAATPCGIRPRLTSGMVDPQVFAIFVLSDEQLRQIKSTGSYGELKRVRLPRLSLPS